MTTYAIIEPRYFGHHLNYVGQLVRAAIDAGDRAVVFTTPPAHDSDEFARFVGHAASQVVLAPDVPTLNQVRAVIGDGVVIYPDGDHHLMRILGQLPTLRSSLHLEVVLMRTESLRASGRRHALRQMVKRAVVQTLATHPRVRVRWLTDSFAVVTSRPGYRRIPAIPDPSTVDITTQPARPDELANLDDDRPMVVLTGVITDRKNPRLLAEAAADADWQVVMAGRVECDVSSCRSTVIDRHLPEAELVWLLANADAVFVGYQTDAPSGILTAAMELGTPAVALTGTWPGIVVQELDAGVVCAPTVPAVAAALQSVTAANASGPARSAIPVPRVDFARSLLGRDAASTARPMVAAS